MQIPWILVTALASIVSPTSKPAYTAKLSGAMETPANATKGTGTASFTLSGNRLTYSVTVHGLSGPATGAHIHVGAAGVAGSPVYTLKIMSKMKSGTVARGTIDLTKQVSAGVSGDSLKTLLNYGNAYVNVHTAAHPDGELRGQVMKP